MDLIDVLIVDVVEKLLRIELYVNNVTLDSTPL